VALHDPHHNEGFGKTSGPASSSIQPNQPKLTPTNPGLAESTQPDPEAPVGLGWIDG